MHGILSCEPTIGHASMHVGYMQTQVTFKVLVVASWVLIVVAIDRCVRLP